MVSEVSEVKERIVRLALVAFHNDPYPGSDAFIDQLYLGESVNGCSSER